MLSVAAGACGISLVGSEKLAAVEGFVRVCGEKHFISRSKMMSFIHFFAIVRSPISAIQNSCSIFGPLTFSIDILF